jgi:hypothetical protein
MPRVLAAAVFAVVTLVVSSAQTVVDTSAIGPRVGAAVPVFEGVDQFGKTRTLSSVLGPKGAMLVFFRSADW